MLQPLFLLPPGNTPLLLAYVKGSGDLCRALVKRGAILGTINKNMVNVFNHPVATKQLLYRSFSTACSKIYRICSVHMAYLETSLDPDPSLFTHIHYLF